MKTLEEIAQELWNAILRHLDHPTKGGATWEHYGIEMIANVIREDRKAREVSEEELCERMHRYAALINDTLAIGQAHADGYIAGFKEAQRMNAIRVLPEIPESIPNQECQHRFGFIDCYEWLKARMTGGEK